MKNKSSNIKESTFKITIIILTVTCLLTTFGFIYYYIRFESSNNELSDIKTGYYMKSWNPGEEVRTPDFGIIINSAKIDKVGIPNHLPAPEGFIFFTIDLTVSNKTNEDKLFLPVDSTYLKDQSGNKYSLTATPDVQQTIAGNIPAGDNNTGQLGFMIPAQTETLKFYFVPYGENAGKTVIVDLNSLL